MFCDMCGASLKNAAASVAQAPAPAPPTPGETEIAPRKRSRLVPIVGGISLAVVIAVALVFTLGGDKTAVNPEPIPAPDPMPAPTRAMTDKEIGRFRSITAREAEDLLKDGADAGTRNKNGWTALMMAARFNENPGVIDVLLKAGPDLNARQQNGWTALMYAARSNGNPSVVTALLGAGADAKVMDNVGNKAIDYARGNKKLAGTDALQALQNASN
jgi:hypothetical protein